MKNTFILLITIVCFNTAIAQQKKLQQANWQQEVNYTIRVSLDDKKHTLSGNINMNYINNSPDTLKEIYIHLWPNAYKNNQTAYARQDVENGNIDFYLAKVEDKGYIDSLAFTIDNRACNWQLTKDIDIAKITLTQFILPNQTVEIATPFFVKIPKVFSRMGHEDQMYCISQWYPKPAVYDVNGWNPMPYLNQGEFYSEYGNFDVSITVPKDYVLAATGELQNKEEREWLLAKSNGDSILKNPSKGETKTLRFSQNKVHDFAWFCSKEFKILHDVLPLADGKEIETWLYAKTVTKKGMEYIKEAVQFYSDRIMYYPYKLVQVVITPLEAGGGMEYPTITNCGSIDRTTIIHEVGHNWFYGILGTNEREYPWMDESLNTYYENRCGEERKQNKEEEKTNNMLSKMFGFSMKGFGLSKLMYAYSSRRNSDQAGSLRSEAYTDNNYGTIVYAKNPLSFRYLQSYLGNDKFDAMMISFFDKWKYKHPLPNDFRKHAEEIARENLSWFFDEILATKSKMDYKMLCLKNVKKDSISITKIKIKNVGGTITPFEVQALSKDNKIMSVYKVNGFEKAKTFEFPAKNNIAKWRIDADENSLDLYRHNNTIRSKGLFKNFTLPEIRFIPSLERSNKKQLFVLPLYAYNYYNKSMLGLYLANDFFPTQKTEFDFAPLYSFTTNDVNGYFKLARNIFTSGMIRQIKIGVSATRFGSNGVYKYDFMNAPGDFSYEKIQPFVKIDYQTKNARSLYFNSTTFRYVAINERATNHGYFNDYENPYFSAIEVAHHFKHNYKLYPTTINTNFQYLGYQSKAGRFSIEAIQSFHMPNSKKLIDIRVFAGAFTNQLSDIRNNSKTYFQAGGVTGNLDYMYDNALIARAEMIPDQSVFARQVINRDAGVRNFAPIGQSKTWLTSVNLTVPFPIKFPIGVYGDMVLWEQQNILNNNPISPSTNLAYNAGLYLSLGKGVFEIYIPFVASQDINDYWKTNGLNHPNPFERASFIFNLNKLNVVDMARNFNF